MKSLAIAETNLRRLVRFRGNIFFLLLLPMLIILLLGAAFGSGGKAQIGVAGAGTGRFAQQLVERLQAEQGVHVSRYGSARSLAHAVSHGRLNAGVAIPSGYDESLRAGRAVRLRYLGRPDTTAREIESAVASAVGDQDAVLGATKLLRGAHGLGFEEAYRRTAAAAARLPRVGVEATNPDGKPYPTSLGRFENGASTQLILFMFVTSLTGAAALIETRRLGVSRRMLSTPTRVSTVLLGEALGRLFVVLVQAAIIVLGSALLFGVGWGDPLGTAAVVLAFALVGTGAGMLLGSALDDEQQAGPAALLAGLGLAAFGGSMVPLEVFPASARRLAHVTPHAWANDAFSQLLRHGGTLADVLGDVGVLLGFAAVLLTLATWRLHRALTRV
jgi:ABC-2 type transport system permease protein